MQQLCTELKVHRDEVLRLFSRYGKRQRAVLLRPELVDALDEHLRENPDSPLADSLLATVVRQVAEASKRLALGDVRQDKIVVRSRDEIAQLAAAFNDMTRYLTETAEAADTIALTLLRDRLVQSPIGDRASSYNDELGTYSFRVVPGMGGNVHAIDAINEWVKRNRLTHASGF